MPDRRFGLQQSIRFLDVLPRDPHDLAQRRIEGALARAEDPTSAREAFLAAALAGPDVPVHVVRAINPEGLDALIATGLVVQDGWRLRFEHAAIAREARSVAGGHPKALGIHARLADAWRDIGERTGSDVALPLGTQRLAAGQANKALEPLLEAAATMLAEGRTALALSAGRAVAADLIGPRSADRRGVTSPRPRACAIDDAARCRRDRGGPHRSPPKAILHPPARGSRPCAGS
jgi:hypothetical protein